MNKIVRAALIGTGAIVGLSAVSLGGFALWATATRDGILARQYPVANAKDVPIPWPLTDAEIAEIRAASTAVPTTIVAPAVGDAPPTVATIDPIDLNAIATERAVARGKHLVSTIYGCSDCHGADLGGHVVVDDPALGAIICPNITSGKGTVVGPDFKASDWDRIVRHGVRPDGTPTLMPAVDFQNMSDRELSDIVSYVRSFPPVDRTMDAPRFGPILTVLVATGKAELSATVIDHDKNHLLVPPETRVDVVYGGHITASCKGCHGANYSGGPITGGDPSWPPAANLTPIGTAGWTEADFMRVMHEGKKKDGTDVKDPMPWKAYGQMSDTELKAMWMYIQTLPPVETGVR